MPEPKDLHLDTRLSRLSVQYRNERLLWRQIMPVVPVMKRSDKYVVYSKADTYRIADDALGPKGLPNEISWSFSDDNYSVKDHGLADWVAQAEIDNADSPIRPLMDTNENLNRALDLAQEERVAQLVFRAATYPTGNKVQLNGTSQWSKADDDPIKNVQDAIEGCFVRANTLIFGHDAWLVFRRLPEILDAVKSSTRQQGTPGGFASLSEIATLFEVDRVLVGRARKNTANPGQTASYGRIWGKHMVAMHVQEGVQTKSVAFGKTFVEKDRRTFRMFDGKPGVEGAHYIKVTWNSDEKVVASDLGYMIEDAVA